MADNYDVAITISANGESAIRNTKKVGDELGKLEGKARQGAGGAKREMGLLDDITNRTKQAVVGLGTAFVAQFSIQAIGALRQTGAEADFAYQRFEALAGGPELVGAAMENLREKTGGAVTDMQLQTDAAGLMLTGLATTAEEAGDLIALGLKLGGEEGVDALSRALKNNSIEMLDNLGISASDVRALRDQYTAAGMDTADAFSRAVLVVGQQTAERLGDAATAGITEFGVLQTRFQNGFIEMGRVVAGAFEDGAGVINDAIESALLLIELANIVSLRSTGTGGSPFAGGSFLSGLITQNPNIVSGGAGLAAQMTGAADRAVMQRNIRQLERRIADSAFASVYSSMQGLASPDIAALQAAAAGRAAQEAMYADNTNAYFAFEGLGTMAGEFGGTGNQRRGMVGDQRLFNPHDLQQAEEYATTLASFYEQYKDTDLLTEEQLATAKQWADEGEKWRDYVEAGVGALKTLPELFGQSDGGLLGGLSDDFLAGLQGDMPDSEFQALTDLFQLGTGQQTAASQQWRDEVKPELERVYEELGGEAALAALQAYQRGAEMGRINGWGLGGNVLGQLGFYEGDDGSLVSTGVGVVPDNVGAGGITPLGGGAEPSSPFGQLLTEGDAVIAKAGDISNAFLQIPSSITPATDSLANAVGVTDTWQKTLDTISSQTYPLKLEVQADLSKLTSIIRDIVRSEQGSATRANGGVPAGVDPRRGGRTS